MFSGLLIFVCSSSCGFLGPTGNFFIGAPMHGTIFRELQRAGDDSYEFRIGWDQFMFMLVDFDGSFMVITGNDAFSPASVLMNDSDGTPRYLHPGRLYHDVGDCRLIPEFEATYNIEQLFVTKRLNVSRYKIRPVWHVHRFEDDNYAAELCFLSCHSAPLPMTTVPRTVSVACRLCSMGYDMKPRFPYFKTIRCKEPSY